MFGIFPPAAPLCHMGVLVSHTEYDVVFNRTVRPCSGLSQMHACQSSSSSFPLLLHSFPLSICPEEALGLMVHIQTVKRSSLDYMTAGRLSLGESRPFEGLRHNVLMSRCFGLPTATKGDVSCASQNSVLHR